VTKANWHMDEIDALLEDDEDPFSMPVEEVGERVDLKDEGARLMLRISELGGRIESMRRRGLSCEIRDTPETTCLACPLSSAGVEGHPMRMLCKTGREYDRVCTKVSAMFVMQEQQIPEPE
jgi:hypothetical protein